MFISLNDLYMSSALLWSSRIWDSEWCELFGSFDGGHLVISIRPISHPRYCGSYVSEQVSILGSIQILLQTHCEARACT